MSALKVTRHCTISGCNSELFCKGMCRRHYSVEYEKKRIRKPSDKPCSVLGCTARYHGRGFCLSHYGRADRTLNPDKHSLRAKAYHAVNRDTINGKKKAIYHATPEKQKARNAARYANNIEKERVRSKIKNARPEVIERKSQRYFANREYYAALNVKWRNDNREQARTINANRRARQRSAEGEHTAEEIVALFRKQQGRCAVCRDPLGKKYHRDHIRPLSAGGENWITNIQLLCGPCNISKKDKDPIAFMQQRGRLL